MSRFRFLLVCTLAVITAGCSDSNQPNPSSPDASSSAKPYDGAQTCSSIGDRVFLDENCDGIQNKDEAGDFTEPGVGDVVVNLYTCEGAFVATTTTDGNGGYLFEVPDEIQDYRVCFVLPDGYSFSPANVGTEGGDSDAGADGCTSCFTGGECKVIRNIDAGLCREEDPCPSTIGDRVWFDEDCEGDQDKNESGDFTEPGVADVVVNLYTCDGAFVATTTTDANGFYNFDVPDAIEDYRVCFVLPDGYSFAPANVGNEGGDSDAGPDGCTSCFTGGECKMLRNIDAGLCREEEGEGEYCSPGFWKNHYTHWAPTGYSPDDVFDDVFDCDLFGDDTTLGEAIHIEQTHNPLAFHAVASLLNASHPDIDIDISVDDVQDAVCDRDKSRLTSFTENCPLSGGNTRKQSQ